MLHCILHVGTKFVVFHLPMANESDFSSNTVGKLSQLSSVGSIQLIKNTFDEFHII